MTVSNMNSINPSRIQPPENPVSFQPPPQNRILAVTGRNRANVATQAINKGYFLGASPPKQVLAPTGRSRFPCPPSATGVSPVRRMGDTLVAPGAWEPPHQNKFWPGREETAFRAHQRLAEAVSWERERACPRSFTRPAVSSQGPSYLHRVQERRGCRRKWSAQSPVRKGCLLTRTRTGDCADHYGHRSVRNTARGT